MNQRSSYLELLQRLKKLALLHSCSSLLNWDEETYMPSGGAEHRSEQLSLLAGLCHENLIAPEMDDLLSTLENSTFTDNPLREEAVNIRETRRLRERAVRVPKSLVEDLARVSSLSTESWKEARQNNHFTSFQPWLEKVIHLRQQYADCLTASNSRYDALIDEYEPGQNTATLTDLLVPMGESLTELLHSIKSSSHKPDSSILSNTFPIDAQRDFGMHAAKTIGFRFEHGRLDVTTHPFCSGIGPGDVRITTRYQLNDFADSFMSILHEAGHGIYEQNLPKEHFGTPCGLATSYGIHESQSRLWENFVGRSLSFWTYFFPQAKAAFPEALRNVTLDVFHFSLNAVAPSLIRTDADEVTYNLHILLRFELEKQLIDGSLNAADLPEAWNEHHQQLLGVTPSDDRSGCLQDIHWSGGSFGYFPSYSLGNIYAAQFFEQAEKDLGNLDTLFSEGDFTPLKEWLTHNIHNLGQRFRADQLVERVTGSSLDYHPLVSHLRSKFTRLYHL